MIANKKNRTNSPLILLSAVLTMQVIIIATMNTPNAFVTLEDDEILSK
jgi:hypothetical protein